MSSSVIIVESPAKGQDAQEVPGQGVRGPGFGRTRQGPPKEDARRRRRQRVRAAVRDDPGERRTLSPRSGRRRRPPRPSSSRPTRTARRSDRLARRRGARQWGEEKPRDLPDHVQRDHQARRHRRAQDTRPDRHVARRRPASPARHGSAHGIPALPSPLGESPPGPLGGPGPVGGRPSRLRARARDQRIQAGGVLVDHGRPRSRRSSPVRSEARPPGRKEGRASGPGGRRAALRAIEESRSSSRASSGRRSGAIPSLRSSRAPSSRKRPGSSGSRRRRR